MPAADKPGVAAFDFDGTLARKDTFVPFLMTACGRSRVALNAAASLPGCSAPLPMTSIQADHRSFAGRSSSA